MTPHVLRHRFASIANDLGFTEVTIAALVGHAKGSVTSKYIHTLGTALIMTADTISGYIQRAPIGAGPRPCHACGLLDGTIGVAVNAYYIAKGERHAAKLGLSAGAFWKEFADCWAASTLDSPTDLRPER